MKTATALLSAIAVAIAVPGTLRPMDAVKPGAVAPAFTLVDQNGTSRSLGDFKGKTVVLEWVNFDCPFVRKHYKSGNMPKLQAEYAGKGVVWLSICSSAPGKQGYFEGEELKERLAAEKAVPTAYLIDVEGTVGKAYMAKNTPTMCVIDGNGIVVYWGAIDDTPSTDPDDIAKARNFVRAALDATLAGKEVAVTTSKPYGCGVKYR